MKEHLQKYLGWYIMIPSIYLAFVGQTEIWLIIFVCLLKVPPFDLVGRYEDWLERKFRPEEKAEKIREKLKVKPRWVRVAFIIGVLILLVLWTLYAPECELC